MSTFPRLASVCPMKWSAMAGHERSRFCPACHKSVVNLSVISEAERDDLLARARPGELCVSYRKSLEGRTVGLGSRLFPEPGVRMHGIAAVTAGAVLAAVAMSGSSKSPQAGPESDDWMILGVPMLAEDQIAPATGPNDRTGPVDSAPAKMPAAEVRSTPPKKVDLQLPLWRVKERSLTETFHTGEDGVAP